MFKFVARGFIFIFFIELGLGCASLNSDRIAPSLSNALEAMKGAIFGYPDPLITREIVENIPYASAMLKIGKGSNGLLILESISDNSFTWVSKDSVYFITKDGRIKQTSGLTSNLIDLNLPKKIFDELVSYPDLTVNYFAYYSYDQPELFSLKVSVKAVNKGFTKVEILGEVKDLLLIEEIISNGEIRWNQKNSYWVDPQDNFVWKSIQHISPKLPPFIFQVTKRPRI